MQDKLKSTFSNVNDWLKFAEIKNAYLIPFSGVFIFGTLVYLKADSIINEYLRYYAYNLVFFQGLALTIILCSFLPQTKLDQIWKREEPKANDNLLYYEHIQKYDANSYLDAFYKANEKEASKYLKIELDYATQIIINSQIAVRKYNYFRIAFWCVTCALLTPIFGIIVYLLIDPNE